MNVMKVCQSFLETRKQIDSRTTTNIALLEAGNNIDHVFFTLSLLMQNLTESESLLRNVAA